ncbi:MAG: DUF3747 domain-containing protein [Cyanobacteriota bacterium]
MKRPYLAFATLALVAGLSAGQVAGVRANGLFGSASVESARFAVLARPVGDDDWTLVVLEQLRARPFCWTPRPDGLVDPSLNRFDYTGICGRFIDSNGYSLRMGDVDYSHAYRLRVQPQRAELLLLASTASRGAELLVGRGPVPRRDRDLFVSLKLEPGWELRRRTFGDRSLNHVYFSNGQSLDSLIATARGQAAPSDGGQTAPATFSPVAPPPLGSLGADPSTPPRTRESMRTQGARPIASPWSPAPQARPATAETPADGAPSAGVVALQVIPYVERGGDGAQPLTSERLSASRDQESLR